MTIRSYCRFGVERPLISVDIMLDRAWVLCVRRKQNPHRSVTDYTITIHTVFCSSSLVLYTSESFMHVFVFGLPSRLKGTLK